jgi:hypothetical protein
VSSTDCQFIGLVSRENTGRGYVETGAGSNRNIVSTARYVANAGGNLIQEGASSGHFQWIGAGGTLIASNIGAISA